MQFSGSFQSICLIFLSIVISMIQAKYYEKQFFLNPYVIYLTQIRQQICQLYIYILIYLFIISNHTYCKPIELFYLQFTIHKVLHHFSCLLQALSKQKNIYGKISYKNIIFYLNNQEFNGWFLLLSTIQKRELPDLKNPVEQFLICQYKILNNANSIQVFSSKSQYQMNMKNAQKVRNLQQNNIKRVNDYVFNVSDKIGEGYTAAVYRGQNCLTGKLVAIKVVNLRKVVNKIQQLLLQSQAKALNMIDHPNILRALHIMQTTNNYYFVTELFQQNLQQFLKKHGRFTQIQVIHFLHVMTNALYYLQTIGILHRDIKPSNIFVRNNDYVLGDFGFCHFVNVPCQQKGFNVGSPLYMSPQSYKSSIYSCKSDIWSLGICIIELLLGYKPFTTLSYDQMIPYLCDKRFYRQFPISNALKQILDLIFQFDFENRITPQNLINLLALNFPNYKIVNVVPSLNNLNLPLQSIQIRNRRSSSINSNKNLKFNIQNSRKLSPLPSPRNKQNQQNRPNMFNNQYNNRKGICSTQKKIENYIQNPKINQNSNINTNVNIPCVDRRLAMLQNLSRLLFNDINLAQSSNKLKLLRILATIQKNQFQNNLSILLTNFPSDPYFNYILHTTNYSNFLQISHYLCFLLQVVYNQLQMECLSHQHKNQNQMEELNCLFNAIQLWRKPKQKRNQSLIVKQLYQCTKYFKEQVQKCWEYSIINYVSTLIIYLQFSEIKICQKLLNLYYQNSVLQIV